MQESKWIWFNGKFVEWEKARVHVLSHALHYGSGVFEGIRAYKTSKGTAVFRLKDHVKRFLKSWSILKLNNPYSQEELEKAILETLRKNELEEAYIRPIIFCGYGEMGLRNLDKAKVEVVIAAWPWPKYLAGDAIKVKIAEIKRINPESLKVEAKVTGHYINSILASIEAKEKGFDEALLLDLDGKVAEGPGENIFLIKDNKLITPSKGSILPGITRDSVIELAKDLGYEVEERKIRLQEIFGASELFFTGTAAEITAIRQVDDKIIGDGKIGKVTEKLKKEFLKVVHGENEKYEKWLSYV